MRNNPPLRFANLKAQKMWSLEFARENFAGEQFTYHVLRKLGEGSYEDHGYAADPNEAFALRRELVAETGITNYFVRAQRVLAPVAPADELDDEAYDRLRDYYSEGFTEEQVPVALRDAYSQFLAAKVSSRSAYKAGTRGGVDQWVR